MKKLYKEKKEFNRAYIPVIVSSILLIVLIVGLVLVIIYNPTVEEKEDNATTTDSGFIVNTDEVSISSSKSACSTKKQKNILNDSSGVSVSFEKTTVESEEEYYDTSELGEYDSVDDIPRYHIDITAFLIKFSGITSNIYVSVTNDSNDESYTFTSDDLKDDIVSFTSTEVNKVVTYTVSVFSNDSDCKGELYRKFTYQTPRVNALADLPICKNNDDSSCDEYIYEDSDTNELIDEYIALNDDSSDSNKDKDDSSDENSKNYLVYIIIGIAFIILIISIVFVIRKKHKKVK